MMKKFVMGLICGMILAFTSSVYADEVAQLIGKQVDNQYPVILNGTALENNAAAIEGTSYAPVREISEKLGLDVKFENETVLLTTKKQEAVPMTVQQTQPETIPNEVDQLTLINGQLENTIRNIGALKDSMNIKKSLLETMPDNENYKRQIEDYTKRIADLEKQKAELEAQKAELTK